MSVPAFPTVPAGRVHCRVAGVAADGADGDLHPDWAARAGQGVTLRPLLGPGLVFTGPDEPILVDLATVQGIVDADGYVVHATSQAPEPSAEPEPTEPAVECLPVAELVAANLAQAISDDSTPARVGAVKSPNSDSYLVAIEISGGPADGLVPIFETLNIDAPGLTRGVDGVAHGFTSLPESAFSVADDASDLAKGCLS